jgi:hypothetical protein
MLTNCLTYSHDERNGFMGNIKRIENSLSESKTSDSYALHPHVNIYAVPNTHGMIMFNLDVITHIQTERDE